MKREMRKLSDLPDNVYEKYQDNIASLVNFLASLTNNMDEAFNLSVALTAFIINKSRTKEHALKLESMVSESLKASIENYDQVEGF